MSEENKELYRQFAKAWDARDFDAFEDFVSVDSIDHNAMPGVAQGLEGLNQTARILAQAFPDMSTEIHIVIAEEDFVAGLQTGRGTHQGELMGMPPTGKSFEIADIHIVRISKGKMVEHWGQSDQASMMMQLGMMPLPPGTPAGWQGPPARPVVADSGTGDPAKNRKVMQKMIKDMKQARIEPMLEALAPDAVDHAAMPGQGPGREGFKERWGQMFSGLSGPDFQTLVSVGEGEFLSAAYTFKGKHTGSMMGTPATGKSFTVPAIDFVRFGDGKIVEHWGLIDFPALMMQLGLMPPPG